jgi:lysozyme
VDIPLTGRAPKLLLVIAALCAACGGGRGAIIVVPPNGSTTEGVDVSKFQGNVNWSAVAGSGKSFAITRVSDGLTVDSTFQQNWQGIASAGLIRGAYQFFQPGMDSAAQAALLLSQIGTLGPGDLPPVLDVEVTGGQPGAQINAEIGTWVAIVQAAIGRSPIIYTAPQFWATTIGSRPNFGTDLWTADWNPNLPHVSSPWTGWEFWQYSISGNVAGIPGQVDLDRFNGSLAELQAYAVQASTVPEPTTMVAGALLLLPLGLQAIRHLRNRKT